jgi:hypothetical protein
MSPRKEIYFFNRYYGRGVGWYSRFFPDPAEADAYRVIGEISPYYLYRPGVPRRIAELGSVQKLLLILRNPVDRAYSDYWFQVRIRNYRHGFEQFLTDDPEALELGFYSRFIPAFLRCFDRTELLVLVFEAAISDIPATRRRLADFLGLDPDRFPPNAGERRVNERFVPRWPGLYARLIRLGAYLQRHDVDWAVRIARRMGLVHAVGRGTRSNVRSPNMNEETRQRLLATYASEVDDLEQLLQQDLSVWRA